MSGTVARVASTEFSHNIGAHMDMVRNGKRTLVVECHGRPQVVVLPVDEYERLRDARRQLAMETTR